MNRPRVLFPVVVTAAWIVLFVACGAFFDPQGTSQAAFTAREHPVSYTLSGLVWFLLLAPNWLPSLLPQSRLGAFFIAVLGILGIALACFFVFTAASGSVGPFVWLFVLLGAICLWFALWHLFATFR